MENPCDSANFKDILFKTSSSDVSYATSFTIKEGSIDVDRIFIEEPTFDIEDSGAVSPNCGDLVFSVFGDDSGTAHSLNSDPSNLWAKVERDMDNTLYLIIDD